MQKLHLHIDKMIQGKFSPKKLNLLLVFQVNCPGCFIYALPTFNKLYEQYSEKLGFLALSTAFEDFTLNSQAHTELLVNKGEVIGETKKMFADQGIDKLPYSLNFPVGMDPFLEPNEQDELVNKICLLNPNYQIWSKYDQDLLRSKVTVYLKSQEKTPLTFTANQFRGTPSIVLFNERNVLLKSWFGHQPTEEIIKSIETFINKDY